MQSLANGTELGAYTIVRLIGRGGMGEVYEAYENRLQRRVALKVIAPAKAGTYGEVDLVRRFLQEARTLAQINHPNVVTIYSIDRVNDVQFIAMEYVEGASFKDLFSLFALSADEAAPIFLQLLEGLKALHDNRILHRDIKPHNLMIRPNGQVKILDFGIAKRLNDRNRENTTVGIVVGTLSYLPPEVLYGSPATPRSDLWSMGAIFFECMVGQPLVSMSSIKVKGARAASDSDVIFPADSLSWIPQEMRAIVGKLCDRAPELRYENAAQAMEDIRHFQMNRPPLSPGAAKAFYLAIDEIDDLKESTDRKQLSDSKRKREFTVDVLGGQMPSFQPVEIEHPSEPIISGVVRDSISARRKAQDRMRFAKLQWQTPAMIIGAVLVAVLLTAKIVGGKNDDSRRSEVQSDELKLVSPSENQGLWLDPLALPTLQWSTSLEMGEYELQIASDANFNAIVIREDVSGYAYRPARVLAEGEYHWQLWPKRPAMKPIGPGNFKVSFLAPLKLEWPRQDQEFNLPRSLHSQLVSFRWKCKPGVKSYGAQVASDPAFTQVVQETLSAGCAWNDLSLAPGTYFWRVRVEDPAEAQSTTLAKRSFVIKGGSPPAPPQTIVQLPPPQPTAVLPPPAPTPAVEPERPSRERPPLKLAAPRLRNPKQSVTLGFAKGPAIRDLASARKRLLEVPQLNWQTVRGAKLYSMQISWNPEFTRLLTEENVQGTTYNWKNAQPGKFYWRVRAHHESGVGPYSQGGSIEVSLPEPVIGSAYKFSEAGPLTWDPVPMAEKYLVQTSVERSMASVKEELMSEPVAPITFNGGDPVYVRVAAANAAGERVGGFSQVATVSLEERLKLLAPGLLTPPKGAKVTLPKSGRISVVFSWNAVEKATDYYVEISKYADFSKAIQKHFAGETKWVLKGAKLEGKVYWRVRAEGKGAAPSGWSYSGYFEVR